MAKIIARKERRKEQIAWLNHILEATGYDIKQIVDVANKTINNPDNTISETGLRGFYGSNDEERLLSRRIIIILYKAFAIEPSFDEEIFYSVAKDNADISEYAKWCKKYIADASVELAIYRNDLAKQAGIDPATIARLFNNKLRKGLLKQTLQKIINYAGYPIHKELNEFLTKGLSIAKIPVTGYVSLVSTDEVIPYADEEIRKIAKVDGLDSNGRAIELKGATLSPFVKSGVIFYYNHEADNISNDCINNTCVINTEDGITAIKLVSRSSKAGYYNLQSLIDNSIETKKLNWACKILLYKQS